MLILRHAWLNLWDKHMTTGRINQVAAVWIQKFENWISEFRWQIFLNLIIAKFALEFTTVRGHESPQHQELASERAESTCCKRSKLHQRFFSLEFWIHTRARPPVARHAPGGGYSLSVLSISIVIIRGLQSHRFIQFFQSIFFKKIRKIEFFKISFTSVWGERRQSHHQPDTRTKSQHLNSPL